MSLTVLFNNQMNYELNRIWPVCFFN